MIDLTYLHGLSDLEKKTNSINSSALRVYTNIGNIIINIDYGTNFHELPRRDSPSTLFLFFFSSGKCYVTGHQSIY